jgi:ankyrin repeat protein
VEVRGVAVAGWGVVAVSGETRCLELLASHKGADNLDVGRTGPGCDDGTTALCAATQECETPAIEILLRYNADVNKPNARGETPAFIAAQHGHDAALKMLIDAGCDLTLGRKNDHWTPEYVATRLLHTPCLKLILHANKKGRRQRSLLDDDNNMAT